MPEVSVCLLAGAVGRGVGLDDSYVQEHAHTRCGM